MSNFGETWRIDGVTAACITRGAVNGQYRVLFERPCAELPAIEAINWAAPQTELLRLDCPGAQGLPAGCGFTVADITYDHASRSYTVTAEVSARYLGDAAGYEAQAEELKEQAAQAQARAQEAEDGMAAALAQAEELKEQAAQAQARAREAEDGMAAALAQAEELREQAALAQTRAREAEADAAGKDEAIAAQALEIETLRADSSAAVMEALECAYREGVESNG